MVMHASGTLRMALIDEVEEYLYDMRLRWNMPNTTDERIVIVDIDERSIAAEGHWPWQRDKLAEVINTLFDEYEIRVLAFDMVFAEPEESTALQLIGELREGDARYPRAQERALCGQGQRLAKRVPHAYSGLPGLVGALAGCMIGDEPKRDDWA